MVGKTIKFFFILASIFREISYSNPVLAQVNPPQIELIFSIEIQEIEIQGNTVFSNSELERITLPFKGKAIKLENLF